MAALVLLVAGAAVALSGAWIVSTTVGARTQASAAASPLGGAAAAASIAPSAAASAAPSPAAPLLEAEMPHAVNGTTLTVQSATDATSLGTTPSNRALDAAMTSLGKTPADLEVADAADASGALALSVLGFRVAGVDPAKLRTVVLDAWLSINTPGVTVSSVNLAGTPATVVAYRDSGPSEYVLVHGDSVLVIETADQSLAANVVAALSAPTPSPSPSGG
ncbi:MAG: hypothetical protein ACLQHS_17695 [Candidatus Limnocylindrales bacterium]